MNAKCADTVAFLSYFFVLYNVILEWYVVHYSVELSIIY
jgi:hypothetical protein